MHIKKSFPSVKILLLASTSVFIFSACGGGGGGGGAAAPAGSTGTASTSGNSLSSSANEVPSEMLAVPSGVASGSTVELQCGKTYFGTLDLKRKTGITVKTAGSCGKAIV